VTYTYDALGRRVKRAYSGNVTKFTYDGLDVVMDDNNIISGTVKYQNGPGIDNKLKMEGSLYFLQDHLGSTVALTKSDGSVTETNSYDSFGNPSATSFSTRYQFTGREFDSFNGLQFSRARWYDPNLGRFISEDPIGFGGGDVNLYGYVRNRPLNRRDPLGLDDADRIYEEDHFPGGYIKWYRDNGIGDIWRNAVKWHDSQPENYRCGPGYFAPHSFVPQSPLGYDFRGLGSGARCFGHDVCYGSCGSKKSDCDKKLLGDLQNECLSKGNVLNKLRCLFVARIYYDAVDKAGQPAYDAAQNDSRCCEAK
jgi:RHS repeat-associated protein